MASPTFRPVNHPGYYIHRLLLEGERNPETILRKTGAALVSGEIRKFPRNATILWHRFRVAAVEALLPGHPYQEVIDTLGAQWAISREQVAAWTGVPLVSKGSR